MVSYMVIVIKQLTQLIDGLPQGICVSATWKCNKLGIQRTALNCCPIPNHNRSRKYNHVNDTGSSLASKLAISFQCNKNPKYETHKSKFKCFLLFNNKLPLER